MANEAASRELLTPLGALSMTNTPWLNSWRRARPRMHVCDCPYVNAHIHDCVCVCVCYPVAGIKILNNYIWNNYIKLVQIRSNTANYTTKQREKNGQ